MWLVHSLSKPNLDIWCTYVCVCCIICFLNKNLTLIMNLSLCSFWIVLFLKWKRDDNFHHLPILTIFQRDATQSIIFVILQVHMFQVSTTPIIRSKQNCNYSLRYWSYFFVRLPLPNVAKSYFLCRCLSPMWPTWPRWREVAVQKCVQYRRL